jgi:subtilisin family serine protease
MSVGALDQPDENGEQRPAVFSNYGNWVNAWAPGVDLVSDYAGNGLEFLYGDDSTLPFHGCAQWSGTSFATPHAAAAVLQYADAHGMSPQAAWHAIRGGRPWVLFD